MILGKKIFLKIIAFLKHTENIQKTLKREKKKKGVLISYAQEKKLRGGGGSHTAFSIVQDFHIMSIIPSISLAILNPDYLKFRVEIKK